ncbi:MAG: hypothetical protein ACREPP_09285 [Rhodanobacteraceae bacterium]
MYIRTITLPAVSLALALLQCACAPSGEDGGKNAPTARIAASPAPHASAAGGYTDSPWGFHMDAPPGWKIRHDFTHEYLANDSWKTYAAPDSRGTAVVSLTLPGSNEITSAEIRVGASRDAREIAQCTEPPDSFRAGSLHHERIGDIDFTAFDAADAAMSHYLDVHGYRALHDGACYAIDLLVYGTNPQVYDPPAMPPFSKEQATARMMPVLRTFRFMR